MTVEKKPDAVQLEIKFDQEKPLEQEIDNKKNDLTEVLIKDRYEDLSDIPGIPDELYLQYDKDSQEEDLDPVVPKINNGKKIDVNENIAVYVEDLLAIYDEKILESKISILNEDDVQNCLDQAYKQFLLNLKTSSDKKDYNPEKDQRNINVYNVVKQMI